MRELRLAQLEPSWGVAGAPVSDADLFTWHCNVAGQPPSGGAPVVLHLELTFTEDYPSTPPKVEVLGSTVRHPNVFSTFICLDMLEGGEWAADEERRRPYCGWSSAYSVLAILRQLQTFFFEGDGTQWWACTLCTLYNPVKNRRCEACGQGRGRIAEIAIEVEHHPGFRCRCGHMHSGPLQPPFPDAVDCDDAPSSAARGAATGVPPERLGLAARARMAHFAGWPPEVVTRVMSFVRMVERNALAGAVPAWRDVAQAPIFWEAQELQCFHEKTGPEEDIIGFGVHAEGRGKLSKLTAHFDAVSLTAWQHGLRRAAWKEPLTHWLPLYISKGHSQRAAPLLREWLGLLAQCSPQGEDSHLPPPLFQSLAAAGAPPVAVDAVVVLPEMMHQLLKQVLDGDRHASLKLLKGYFVLHRLFLHVCAEWPAIRLAADVALRNFASAEEHRTKSSTPWLAYMLQLLTVSNVTWDEVRLPFVEEVLARSVQFTRASCPHYQPKDPDEQDQPVKPSASDPSSEWELSEHDHGSEREPGTKGAKHTPPSTWQGRPRGWCCLRGGDRRPGGQHAFSIRILFLPPDSVVRIGWTTGGESPFDGWCYYASPSCFGSTGWKASGELGQRCWVPYGEPFYGGDVLTACIDQGTISFRRNGVDLGIAFRVRTELSCRPLVAMKRGAQVELLPADTVPADMFVTPERSRGMAWEARLNRRGNTLVMFQVFFLSLVRPKDEGGTTDWAWLQQEYDSRLGFPSPAMSASLMEHFGEVRRVIALDGSAGWPAFFRALGFEDFSPLMLDRMLFAAFQRASRLNYKMGGRHDHA